MIESTIYAIIGVLFYEAIRIYRCIISSEPIIPRVGISQKHAYFFYFSALIVFCVVAVILALNLVMNDPLKAFMFGVGIPTGSRFITAPNKPKVDDVNDISSEISRGKPKFSTYIKAWLIHYNV